MFSQAQSIRVLASAFAAGPLVDPDEVMRRLEPLVAQTKRVGWLKSLAQELTAEFRDMARPSERLVATRIGGHEPFIKAWMAGKVRVLPTALEGRMLPAPGAPRSWRLPEICHLGELARWLGLHPDDLGWLTAHGIGEHFLYRWRVKPKSGRYRLLEIPKPLLKHVQGRILHGLLDEIPPHEAAQGFRKGKSIRGFVEPHVRKRILIRMDLEDFFPSIGAARVRRLFLTAGYPESVAQALTALTTHAVPSCVLAGRSLARAERRRLADSHLPQGAPSSPALANLCAFRLDCRLAGLAKIAGAEYTRYADDLLFSGGVGFARQATRFRTAVAAIILDEGFIPNERKTRVQRSGLRQEAAGLSLNAKVNIKRQDYDRLKAILTNCVHHGPNSQNRQRHPEFAAHLLGRIAWVRSIHPVHGEKLSEIYERIDWS